MKKRMEEEEDEVEERQKVRFTVHGTRASLPVRRLAVAESRFPSIAEHVSAYVLISGSKLSRRLSCMKLITNRCAVNVRHNQYWLTLAK